MRADLRFPNLAMVLARRRVTQFEVARVIRVSEATISRILTGRREPAPHEKTRIAELLQTDESFLFQEVVVPPLKPKVNDAPAPAESGGRP